MVLTPTRHNSLSYTRVFLPMSLAFHTAACEYSIYYKLPTQSGTLSSLRKWLFIKRVKNHSAFIATERHRHIHRSMSFHSMPKQLNQVHVMPLSSWTISVLGLDFVFQVLVHFRSSGNNIVIISHPPICSTRRVHLVILVNDIRWCANYYRNPGKDCSTERQVT